MLYTDFPVWGWGIRTQLLQAGPHSPGDTLSSAQTPPTPGWAVYKHLLEELVHRL